MRLGRNLLSIANPYSESAAKGLQSIPADTPIRAAARMLAEQKTDALVLRSSNQPIGIVSIHDILMELSGDYDSMTGLPRSGAIRDWLVEKLSSSIEVSVVFIDLDRFGDVNREAGHSAGDLVLCHAATSIASCCKEGIDFPARFGGDEFAIGSVRDRFDSEQLAAAIAGALSDSGIRASVGIAGGRRKAARSGTSSRATVEDLLTLASLACLNSKANR